MAMCSIPGRRRFAFALRCAAPLLVAAFAACGGGSGGDSAVNPPAPVPTTATFSASGTPSAPNVVTMTGATVSGSSDRVEVQIKTGAPTTSSDVFAYAFDIVMSDPNLLAVTSVVAGGALTGAPNASAVISGTRVVVGVTKLGGVGNRILAGEETVISITFRTLKQGSTTLTFAGSPSNPQNPTSAPTALDSLGVPITSITFDTAAATITQP